MDFNFDEIIPRRNTRSYKWDSAPAGDVLPLWVADMDFRTAPAVIEALERRVRHGIFGYVRVPDEYYEAVIRWFERRHGWRFERDWMIYTSGVVPAVSAVIKALTEPGDGIVVQTPVYNCFFSSIRNNGCRIVTNPLKYEDQTYHIDYEDLERKTSDPSVKLLLFCNPHNPAGRVWTREELRRVGDICLRNHVMIISDEIHCELVFPGYTYTPFASLGDSYLRNTITCVSPSKSFNLAGLQIANIIACDKTIRERIDRAININEVCDVNPFGVEATIAAYNEGEEWLMRLLDYLKANYEDMNEFFRKYLPRIPVTKLPEISAADSCYETGRNLSGLDGLPGFVNSFRDFGFPLIGRNRVVAQQRDDVWCGGRRISSVEYCLPTFRASGSLESVPSFRRESSSIP